MASRRKFQILAGLTSLILLGVAVSCTGFFVNPQLQTVVVSPTNALIQVGNKLQMSAVGTFDDGSRKTLTSDVFWSTSDPTNVPITNSGQVSATNFTDSPATITAESQGISGTGTVTVFVPINALKVDPSTSTINGIGGTTTYTCTATLSSGGTQDFSALVTWTITDNTGTAAVGITPSQGITPMTVTTTTGAVPGTYTVTASFTTDTQTFNATATLILNQ
jgi:hypothetical protein